MSSLLRLTLRISLPLAVAAAALAWAWGGAWASAGAALGASAGFSLALGVEAAVRGVVAGLAGGASGRWQSGALLVLKIIGFGGLPMLVLYATMSASPEGEASRKTVAAAFAAGFLAPMAALAAAGWRLSRGESR